jgi:hypothetical protein
MWDTLWLPDADKGSHALHSGPFLPMKSCAPSCDTSKLKCTVCLYAKASTRTPNNQAARPSPKACDGLFFWTALPTYRNTDFINENNMLGTLPK